MVKRTRKIQTLRAAFIGCRYTRHNWHPRKDKWVDPSRIRVAFLDFSRLYPTTMKA